MKFKNVFYLIAAIAVAELAGGIGSVFTVSSLPTWYAGLVKPALNPPSWVFGPVWTTLYALMGISLFLIWKSDPLVAPKERRRGIMLFFLQLVLNTLWSILFFGLHSPGWALVEMMLLWVTILATIISFVRISKPVAWLLVPYILWVSFAGYLNYSLWILN